MRDSSLIFPMLAMVFLTAFVLVRLFRSRVRAVREGRTKTGYYRIYQGDLEPEYSAKPARHFSNLFEAPTLFYAACLAAMVTRTTGPATLTFAWAYVAARVAHAYVHLGRNELRPRIAAFFSGWAVLLAMWTWIAVRVATTS